MQLCSSTVSRCCRTVPAIAANKSIISGRHSSSEHSHSGCHSYILCYLATGLLYIALPRSEDLSALFSTTQVARKTGPCRSGGPCRRSNDRNRTHSSIVATDRLPARILRFIGQVADTILSQTSSACPSGLDIRSFHACIRLCVGCACICLPTIIHSRRAGSRVDYPDSLQ